MEDHPDSNVMTSPTPETVAEQQVLRVTDPGPKTTETTPARQKDPKKVAAGRAGAAARKAKQARLLEELRKAKESQRNMENTSGAPPDQEVEDSVAPPAGTPAKEKDEEAAPVLLTAGSTTPWIIGAAAGLGLAYWAASQRAPVDPPALPPKKSVTPPPAQQLKVEHNPFYME